MKIAVMAVNEAKSIKPRRAQNRTLTHTAITGVCVLLQIRSMYSEKGNIRSTHKLDKLEESNLETRQIESLLELGDN